MIPRIVGPLLLLLCLPPGVLLYVANSRPLRQFARDYMHAMRSVWFGPVTL